jgi:hypothetical protein
MAVELTAGGKSPRCRADERQEATFEMGQQSVAAPNVAPHAVAVCPEVARTMQAAVSGSRLRRRSNPAGTAYLLRANALELSRETS